ncbi:MAG TPA: CAP domain-containing protein [Kofleriaceae bacterium]|nr:CAP domain-containing protein [Kofleriaceae bacterium]
MRTRSYLAVLLVVAACGGDDGGGGDDDGGGDVPALSYCDPVRDWPASAIALEAQIVTIVNQHRAAGATCGGVAKPSVPPLTTSSALRCAARVHTKDMSDRDFFDHTNPSGEDPFERMVRAGYEWSSAGENIAGGGATAESTMEQWMGSTGHCNNIMSDRFVDIGVGHVESDRLWTQVFGTPQ